MKKLKLMSPEHRGTFNVKQIRFNGISAAGTQFSFNPGAPEQALEIVLSDQAGGLSGTVRTEDGKAVVNAKVRLTPWPATVISEYPWKRAGDSRRFFREFRIRRPRTWKLS